MIIKNWRNFIINKNINLYIIILKIIKNKISFNQNIKLIFNQNLLFNILNILIKYNFIYNFNKIKILL